MSLEINVLDIGRTSYQDAWKKQQELLIKRQQGNIPDTLILAEHPPTITMGATEKYNVLHVSEESLKEQGIAFFKSSRGGGAAFLGPGQLIGYTIMDIHPHGGVLAFLKKIEDIMIQTAGVFNIPISRYDVMNPTTEKPYRATWYRENGNAYVLCTKGIGLQIRSNGMFTHHGFALNVFKDDSYFHLIDPCGFPTSQVRPISMEEILGIKPDLESVKTEIVKNFKGVFENNATS